MSNVSARSIETLIGMHVYRKRRAKSERQSGNAERDWDEGISQGFNANDPKLRAP